MRFLEKWQMWFGGDAPVSEETIVYVRRIADATTPFAQKIAMRAGEIRWEWMGDKSDVVSFKIAAS